MVTVAVAMAVPLVRRTSTGPRVPGSSAVRSARMGSSAAVTVTVTVSVEIAVVAVSLPVTISVSISISVSIPVAAVVHGGRQKIWDFKTQKVLGFTASFV